MAQAQSVRCLANNRVLLQGMLLYARDNRGDLPATSWSNMRGTVASWAMDGRPAASFSGKAADVEKGSLYPYVSDRRCFRCAADKGPWAVGSVNNLTSYNINGAVSGYGPNYWNSRHKLESFNAKSCIFFEVPMLGAGNGSNDVTNFPTEGIAIRHSKGLVLGYIDGTANVVTREEYIRTCKIGPSYLWCNPTDADGGMSRRPYNAAAFVIEE